MDSRTGSKRKTSIRARRNLVSRTVKAVGPQGEEMVFIGTQGLIGPAKEIRVELVYTLTAAKILK